MRRLLIAATIVLGFGSLAYAQLQDDLKQGPFHQEKNAQRAFGVPQAPKVVAVSTTTARTSTDFTRPNAQIMIICTTAAFYKLGDSTVTAATATDQYWPADTPDWFNVGSNTRIAFITSVGTGTCYATEMKTVLGGN